MVVSVGPVSFTEIGITINLSFAENDSCLTIGISLKKSKGVLMFVFFGWIAGPCLVVGVVGSQMWN